MAITELVKSALQHSPKSNNLKLLLAISAFFLYKYRSHAVGTRRRPDLKEPKGAYPLLGHMPLLAMIPGTKLYDFFEKNYRELGPVWSISLPVIGRMIQGDTPEMVEHVLKSNFWAYEKGPIFKGALGDLFGDGIFASDGPTWKFQRKQASHIFNVKAFREYTSDVFVIEAQKVLEYLGKAADAGTEIDFHALMLHFTLDSFGAVSFGESFGCLENIESKVDFAVSFDDLTATCSDRLMDPAWKIREALTSVGAKAKYDKALIRKHSLEIIQRRRAEGFKVSPGGKKDLLQLFMEAKDDEGKPLSDEYLVDIILNFTIAGRDTTAQALSWMFYLINRDGTDKEIMKTLIKEVDEVLGDGLPTYETHKQQKYAEACFNEALRIYPSVPRNLKMCVQDDTLPDGTKIHAGEWFTWSSYVMGRSEAIWGPDVLAYNPDRWINTDKPSQGKFSSFHAGPRVCLGQNFAVLEALTVIGMILQKFELTLVDSAKVPAYGVSVTMPMLEGLPMKVTRRQKENGAVAL
ncbi:Protein kinase alk2 [Linnemannia elongata]|nr:Protein kinase alk2 [Linnemannia elongata]